MIFLTGIYLPPYSRYLSKASALFFTSPSFIRAFAKCALVIWAFGFELFKSFSEIIIPSFLNLLIISAFLSALSFAKKLKSSNISFGIFSSLLEIEEGGR